MKAFALFNVGMICGSCGWACAPDSEANIEQGKSPALGGFGPIFYCGNGACPQHDVKFQVKPIEMEVVSNEQS